MPHTDYNHDVILWAREQAALLRAGRFAELDIVNIAEEIEDVGKSEQRELASRMAVLLMHLLKWRYQPERRTRSWLGSIREQRRQVLLKLKRTPSLRHFLQDADWLEETWADAVSQAIAETGLDCFPRNCPWSLDGALTEGWLPDDPESEQ